MTDTPEPTYYRRVFKIRAEDSPNVRYARAEQAAGKHPSGRVIIPGVLPWLDYVNRRNTWDAILQTIGLDGEFYEGAENLLYPPQWLNYSHDLHDKLAPIASKRLALAIGIDPAEGGAKSSWSVVDQYGLMHLLSKQTPDTTVIPSETIRLINEFRVDPTRVVFDRGGGGKQHADTLRRMGYKVRTVAFGETVMHDPRRGLQHIADRLEEREDRYAYTNRRSQMYGELSLLMDPSTDHAPSLSKEWIQGRGCSGFAIPRAYTDLRHQLSPIPRQYDPEGRLMLPPKNRRPDTDQKKVTLVELIGYSPDDADSLVLAVHGLLYKSSKPAAGAMR